MVVLPSIGKTTLNTESSIPEPHVAKFEALRRKISDYISLSSKGLRQMPTPLVVSIPHRLGREEARRRLQAGLTRAAATVPVLKVDEERWDGDRMIFRVRALG